MALSFITYTGDGAQTDWNVPFGYLSKDHVVVLVAGIQTTFTWVSDSLVRLPVAPVNGAAVVVKRTTPNITRLVDFQNGSTLDAEADLNLDSNQLFYLIQELVDGGTSASTETDTFSANGTNTSFALTTAPAAGTTPTVTVNGVAQVAGTDYTISGQTLTFTHPPTAGATVVVVYTTTTSTSSGSGGSTSTGSDPGSWTYDIFTGDGATPSFVLKTPPGNLAVLDVAVNGSTKTPGTDYLLSGQTITFLTPPAAAAVILVRYGATLPATAVSIIQEVRTATAAQTVFGLTSTYQPGTGTMMVFVNGLILVPGIDYTETDATTVTIGIVLLAGDSVLFVYGNPINTNTVDGSRLINGTVATAKLADASVTLAKLSTSLQAQLNSASNPTGKVDWFISAAAPSGWVQANGGTIGSSGSSSTNRANSDTSALFTALWTDWANTLLPIQDSTGALTTRGSTAAADFAANKRLPLPDLRGEFVRGWDNSRGVDTARVLGSFQADDIKAHTHTRGFFNNGASGGGSGGSFGSSNNTGSTGNAETRPRNVAMLACIKL